MIIENKIQSLGITLPKQSAPKAMYIPTKRLGNTLFVSGQVPFIGDQLCCTGKVGDEVSLEQAQDAARICIINLLSAVKAAVGDLDKVKSIVKIQAFVNSKTGFNQQHIVVNAASQLLFDIFGENGRHARTAVGTNQIPMDAPVEIEGILEIED